MPNNASRKIYFVREPRVESHPHDRNYVRIEGQGDQSRSRAAQFSNVSVSGMSLISRQPNQSEVGDLVEVEFSLPGTRIEMKAQALVVRKISDFEFAVAFANFTDSKRRLLQTALHDYIRYLRTATFAKVINRLSRWTRDHQQGIAIALVGVIIFAGAFTWIYRHSDQYYGKELRPWGSQHPAQWDWDYYNKIPKGK